MLDEIEKLAQRYEKDESCRICKPGYYVALYKIEWLQINQISELNSLILKLTDIEFHRAITISRDYLQITFAVFSDFINKFRYINQDFVKYETKLIKIELQFCKLRQVTKEKYNSAIYKIDC